MKIVALMGSPRKNGWGCKYTAIIEKKLRSMSDADFEYLFLSDHEIKMCRGCMVCYEKGEEACPLKDGHLDVVRKLLEADAVIFYSPTYTVSISGMLKNFFDRSSYICHRPLFKGKHALLMTSVGAFGDKQALDTLKWIVSAIGFRITGRIGICSGSYEKDSSYAWRIDKKLEREACRLLEHMKQERPIQPTFTELVAYNYQKNFFGSDTEGCRYDKKYWRESGWADPSTGYFYDVKISPVKKTAARLAAKILIKTGILAA